MVKSEEFETCPFCGASVKTKNMSVHKIKVHFDDMKGIQKNKLMTKEEIDAVCERATELN
ncbi:MAG: hypothetical protein U9O96_02220 [Candidatus Thermoplasmatota archaeon]|nr:hypothetical protein [Candidatus Thermoplasmatota archaeon]